MRSWWIGDHYRAWLCHLHHESRVSYPVSSHLCGYVFFPWPFCIRSYFSWSSRQRLDGTESAAICDSFHVPCVVEFYKSSHIRSSSPQRWFPRTFGVYGSSHQIMYVLVMCGAWPWTQGLASAFDYRYLEALEKGSSCATNWKFETSECWYGASRL